MGEEKKRGDQEDRQTEGGGAHRGSVGDEKIELERVAEIARLKLSDEERESLRKDIEGMLAYFSEINAIKGLEKVREMNYVNEGKNKLRDDGAKACAESGGIFALFTRKEGKYLVAPKSLE